MVIVLYNALITAKVKGKEIEYGFYPCLAID